MEQKKYLINNTNRIENVVDDIINLRYPDDMMLELMDTLKITELVPQVGRYYTFIYSPKTPRIEYDEFPLIACIGVFNWGFRGVNYHWAGRGEEPFRNYTWEELASGELHLIYPLELNDMRSIPYQKFRINN